MKVCAITEHDTTVCIVLQSAITEYELQFVSCYTRLIFIIM